ncbi:MAG: YbjN domain-containing protein [Prochloraceae cyanobacterium]
MINPRQNYNLDNKITLNSSSNSPLPLHLTNLSLSQENDTFTNCYLTFKIDLETYQNILTESLFNLKPEARTKDVNFQPSADIILKVTIHPEVFPQLGQYSKDVNLVSKYFLDLNKSQPKHPLFSTENWFAIEVKQELKTGEIGYLTFWSYVSPLTIISDNLSEEEIKQRMLEYFQNSSGDDVPVLSEEAKEEEIKQITDSLAETADDRIKEITNSASSELIESLERSILKWAKDTRKELEPDNNSFELLNAAANYFQNLEWQFIKSFENSTIQFTFSGENGRWNCLLKTRENQAQLVFYSICPIPAPESKRIAIAEFITRANYNIIIGNFELDFDDGEIRYKTSIDVEGDRLSHSNLESIIYPNLGTIDRYLPGIKAIIERFDDISVKQAIEIVEK